MEIEDIYIAINDDEDFTRYIKNYGEDQVIVLNNVTRIAFGGSLSVLTRAVFGTPFDMTVTSNTKINDSKNYSAVSSNPRDAEFLGWYDLTQDTIFNVSIVAAQ